MNHDPTPGTSSLVLLTAVVALQLAQGRSADEINLMSAFFVALSDNLALITAQCPQ